MITKTNDLLDFSNKKVIVTGASQGIGAGVARRFSEAGANVVLHYRGGKAGAMTVVEEITKADGQASAVQADLSNPEASASLVQQAVESYGGLDIDFYFARSRVNHDDW